MRRILLLFSGFLFIANLALALDVPVLKGRVNDYASLFSPETIQSLEAKLKNLEQTDSTQIVVLTIPSLEGEVIEEYSIKVATKWGIGQKGIDNGALIVIAKQDRKTRIEVGKGLEGKLTDLAAGRIVDFAVNPKFKEGDYNAGIIAGVDAIIAQVKGEYKASDIKEKRGPSKQAKTGGSVFIGIIFLFFIVIVLASIKRFLGIGAGVIGGPVVYGLSSASFMGPLGFIFAGIAGALFALVVSAIARSKGGGYSSHGGGYYSGGYSSYSSDTGSSDSFSGGGGDFSGGGASGDW